MDESAYYITREELRKILGLEPVSSTDCALAHLSGTGCAEHETCAQCLCKSLKRMLQSWEKEVIDLKIENKNMCSRQDLLTEKRKTAATDMERSRLQLVNKWLIGALDAASFGAKPEARTCSFVWSVFDVGESYEYETWWCTGCRSEVDYPEGIPAFCPNCGRRVC